LAFGTTGANPGTKEFTMKKAILAIAAAGMMASACASDGYGGTNEATRQGVVGAGIGAVAGAIIGNNVGGGNAATGALIGGAIGGTAGAIRGSNQDRANQQRYRDSKRRLLLLLRWPSERMLLGKRPASPLIPSARW
jgi:phage tail tape-measure protein